MPFLGKPSLRPQTTHRWLSARVPTAITPCEFQIPESGQERLRCTVSRAPCAGTGCRHRAALRSKHHARRWVECLVTCLMWRDLQGGRWGLARASRKLPDDARKLASEARVCDGELSLMLDVVGVGGKGALSGWR